VRALVSMPQFGSLWLEDAYYDEELELVVGTHMEDEGWPNGALTPVLMNFPRRCVRKTEQP